MIDIVSIDKLLSMNLAVPDYQRPYKWSYKNMVDLLGDLSGAISNSEKYNDYKYRVGTVILHKVSEDGEIRYDIVDGQQRILSLVLIMLCLDSGYTCPLLETLSFKNKITQMNLHNNFFAARDYLSNDKQTADNLLKTLKENIEVVLICVDKVTEAFQLFDSQNTRGKALDPHDLLKAYHLREMKDYPYEMRHAVTKWEAVKAEAIKELFNLYLFPIKNWSFRKKTFPFTAKEIDAYKGIHEGSAYTYAKRANNAMPYYQITAPFLAGNSFFEMVGHYLELLFDIKEEIKTNDKFKELYNILNDKEYVSMSSDGTVKYKSAGFGYTVNLFYCVLLCYYDKFRNFDERAVKKLFTWAFMLRVDMENLSFESINKYAIGDEKRYSNSLPMFTIIYEARIHTEIANLPVNISRPNGTAAVQKWNNLYDMLKELNGAGGVKND